MSGSHNRCQLCGAATTRAYCYAHSWAGYQPTEPRPRTPAAAKPIAARAAVPLELVAGASTGSGRRLVARRTA